MCNPRRVEVTATAQVHEAWEREVRRVAAVAGGLTGEARIRQSLDASIGGPALMALRQALFAGLPGWEEQEDGSFRHPVEGGYGLFNPQDNTLEIVATLSEELRVEGAAQARLTGHFTGTVEAVGKGDYYDDGWGGRTEEWARRVAGQASQEALAGRIREQVNEAAESAVQAQEAALQAEAESAARREWEETAARRREELSRRAANELSRVGVAVRLAFHRLLARGYRDALLSLARRRGVRPQDILLNDTDDVLEIELTLPD